MNGTTSLFISRIGWKSRWSRNFTWLLFWLSRSENLSCCGLSSHGFSFEEAEQRQNDLHAQLSAPFVVLYVHLVAEFSHREQQQTQLNEYFFPVLGFVTFKRLVPRGFISIPFQIFSVLFDGVTWLLVVWRLVMMLIEVPQSIWNSIFLSLIIISVYISLA